MKRYSEDLEKIIIYGHEKVDSSEMVEVNLRNLLYVYSVMQEYIRFFHQPNHYKSLDDINNFLGCIDEPKGFKILHESVYNKMRDMLPEHIHEKYDEGDFDSPSLPFYYNEDRKYEAIKDPESNLHNETDKVANKAQ